MRAYFTLEYSGTGDGLIFALINGQLNQLASAGGDYAAPELLGYAGDSRTNNPADFLDTTGLKGLRPPKMGLEFDAKRNWDPAFEAKPVGFLQRQQHLKRLRDTRNDPDPASATKDFVQYVYWGNTSGVNVPCRTTPTDRSSTYDDNRHNPGGTPTSDWFQPLSDLVDTSPTVSPDGRTVYVATNNTDNNPTSGTLYAIDLDAKGYVSSVRSWGPASGGVKSPVIDGSGNIYFSSGNKLYSLRPNLSSRPNFPYTLPFGNRASQPVIGPDGTIYVSAYDGVKFGYLYAINPSPDGPQARLVRSTPRSSSSSTPPPSSLRTAPLVIAATDCPAGLRLENQRWPARHQLGVDRRFHSRQRPKTRPGSGPVLTAKGTVYVGAGDRRVYALSGVDGSTLLTSPVIATEGLATQPVVAGGTVYVGSFDDNLYALDTSDLSVRWSFYAAGQCAIHGRAVDSNGTVYFGSDIRDPFADNQNVNALYSDGTVKWRYSTGSGDVRGTPLVRPDGTVYIGSFNSNLYAINQFAVPKSLKDKSITYETGSVGGVAVSVDNTEDWLKSSLFEGPLGRAHGGLPQHFPECFRPHRLLQLPAAHLGAPMPAGRLQRRDRLVLRRHPSDLFTGAAPAPDGADYQPQFDRKHPISEIHFRLHVPDGVGRQPKISHPRFEVELRAGDRPDRHLRPELARLNDLPVVAQGPSVHSLFTRLPIFV